MLWLALELEEIGLWACESFTGIHLRSSVTWALSKCIVGCPDPLALVAIPSNGGSPYASASSPHASQIVLAPFSRVSEATKDFASLKIVIIPLQRSAEDLATFLEEAPIVRRGPMSKSS